MGWSKGDFQKRFHYLSSILDLNYEECRWIDGTDCQVYVREKALPEIMEYLEKGGVNNGPHSHASFYGMDDAIPANCSHRSYMETNDKGCSIVLISTAIENPYRDVYDLFSTLTIWSSIPP